MQGLKCRILSHWIKDFDNSSFFANFRPELLWEKAEGARNYTDAKGEKSIARQKAAKVDMKSKSPKPFWEKAEEGASKFCTECGIKFLSNTDKFCGSCGHKRRN